jgi:hypothetical protein
MGNIGSGGHNVIRRLTDNSLTRFYARLFLTKELLECKEEVRKKVYEICEEEGSFLFEYQTNLINPLVITFFISEMPSKAGYKIQLSPKKLGGYQAFWCCPICYGRYTYLFKVQNAPALLCRKCLDIRYESQREGKEGHLINKQKRIVKALGLQWENSEYFPSKPKNMHNKRYDEYANKFYEISSQIEDIYMNRLASISF